MTLTEKQIKYTLHIIAKIAFPGLEYECRVNANEVSIRIKDTNVQFSLLEQHEASALLSGKLDMTDIPSRNLKYSIPVAFPQKSKDTNKIFYSIEGDEVKILADIVTLSFILLSRYEDYICTNRDAYGRMSYKDSLAKVYDFIDIPIVDEYALLVRKIVCAHSPTIIITPRVGQIIPTHDIDNLLLFPNVHSTIKRMVWDFLYGVYKLKPKDSLRAIRTFMSYITGKDPYVKAIYSLAKLSKNCGFRSEFYFLGYDTTHKDYRYDANNPLVRDCMKYIEDVGMVVGFHAGFGTCDNDAEFLNQKDKVDNILGKKATRGRQHFLCFNHNSPAVWDKCGMETDMTLGYHDREGFACGTSHPYPLYDIMSDTVLNVIEQPLIVMDGTLLERRNLSPSESLERIVLLCNRTLDAEGDFVILWHNSGLHRKWYRYYTDAYVPFMKMFSK